MTLVRSFSSIFSMVLTKLLWQRKSR